ncbi:hypothetical protein HU200_052899 [Digitaria exilis]|uniref:Nodulin-like domain-containing protein n=1 Tax=Digitaria exilis TaxID=1010633 RepID=A0A835E5B8_9POAL|nr:hypothetical protein HU200_052899 [Digitaria exilis]
MGKVAERLGAFSTNRWLVFVAAMWLQSMAGVGYLFGAISPVIKAALGYNQRQMAALGFAKNLGDCVGFLAGALSATLPAWGLLLIGAAHSFLGYGWLWLVVSRQAPALPLWMVSPHGSSLADIINSRASLVPINDIRYHCCYSDVCSSFVGTNYSTYFNTASLVTCIQNFPKSRGPTMGILKAFSGLSSAFLTQIYAVMHTPDRAALIFMIAVGPALVAIGLMFVIRPVGGQNQERPSDYNNFMFIYSICLLLASYLVGVMLLQDFVQLSDSIVVLLTAILFILLVSPLAIPATLTLLRNTERPIEEALLSETSMPVASTSQDKEDQPEVILSEVEEDKTKGINLLPPSQSRKWIVELQAKLGQAAARGKQHQGENFTLMQALANGDFWLIWLSLLLGAGSGLSVMDNLGQMSQAVGFKDAHIFVSLTRC